MTVINPPYMDRKRTIDSIVTQNDKDYRQKQNTLAYLYPFVWYALYILIFSLTFLMKIISRPSYVKIIVSGGLLYMIRVVYLLYQYKQRQGFSKKMVSWGNDNLRENIRHIIPDDYFKCPADCKLKT